MDQALAKYTPNWRKRLIDIYIGNWITQTYLARNAAQRKDWPKFSSAFDSAVVYLRMVLDLLSSWSAELDGRVWTLGQRPAEPMTDAQIFDACYRELVKRWT